MPPTSPETGASGRPVNPVAPAPSRLIIEAVAPEIDAGAFPIKRTLGEEVVVTADIFSEGHDLISAVVLYRCCGASGWAEAPMRLIAPGTDRWEGRFTIEDEAPCEYTILAWVDRFGSWRYELSRKVEAGQDVASELLEGGAIVQQAAQRAEGPDAAWLAERAKELASDGPQPDRCEAALDPGLAQRMARWPDRSGGHRYERDLRVTVDRERARFGAWYELFPRSASDEPGRHGTFRDVEARLPYVAGMGFDVLYLPPIHPIGVAHRKGPNNTLTPGPGDPGSPWAIGGPDGGHTAVHPELGTIEDFDRLVKAANRLGLEVALDIAFQCSPDHPWVREHPEWFRHRPDGTIKYAENPPKKYQDIYPLEFDTPHWRSLYEALRDVFLYWLDHGVRIFRVDNPHTKPFRFWDWVIAEVQKVDPGVIFLAEAFTRPKLMKRLAKGGFTQSYSYFTWRNHKDGLVSYFNELTRTEAVEFMRPNLFANTPDILNEYLQVDGKAAFQIRLVLAATLGATYGIYGPPFEQCVGTPVRPGSEEYLDSEKYQVRHWDLDRPGTLVEFITRVNAIRRDNPALQFDRTLRFLDVDNPQLIAYAKALPDQGNLVVVVVNLDPRATQGGTIHLPLEELGIASGPGESFQVHDLLADARYLWNGDRNYVELNPGLCPAHIFRVRRRVKTERDFDYFL